MNDRDDGQGLINTVRKMGSGKSVKNGLVVPNCHCQTGCSWPEVGTAPEAIQVGLG
jgi:hypothetical protein